MTNTEAKELQKQYKAQRDALYDAYPQVKAFDRTKRRFLGFLLLAVLALNLTKLLILSHMTQPLSPLPILFGVIAGSGYQIIFLLAAMSPKWKISICLYLLGFGQLFRYGKSMADIGITSPQAFFQAFAFGFREHPFIVSTDILSLLAMFLIIIAAVWLTLIPKNRMLAEQSEQLDAQWRQFIASHPIK